MKVEVRNNKISVEGYVNAVERESNPIPGAAGKYIEIVKAGTFASALQTAVPVELRYNHNKVLGDTNDGTLTLKEDNIGLYAKAIITNADIISIAITGKLKGWSFGFIDNNFEIKNGKRILTDITLLEVSILDITPAYNATSVITRNANNEVIEQRSIIMDFGHHKSKEIDILKLKGRM
ncbi:MAG: hypothetical protein BEN18_10315 [Epulopiscium sp. Nuni2H_MBin001]|nr:MAG: hypothetical protein BEN18_10315 [Epulopiscium sp. Nuni2H_MBin001]